MLTRDSMRWFYRPLPDVERRRARLARLAAARALAGGSAAGADRDRRVRSAARRGRDVRRPAAGCRQHGATTSATAAWFTASSGWASSSTPPARHRAHRRLAPSGLPLEPSRAEPAAGNVPRARRVSRGISRSVGGHIGAPPRDYVCGSSTSRRPSPSRFRPSTVRRIVRPGKIETCGAVRRKSRALASMVPHSGVGGWAPRPRKPR